MFYRLLPRVEVSWYSLKSLVVEVLRSRTIQTVKHRSGQKSPATTSSGQSEDATDFELKPINGIEKGLRGDYSL